MGARDEIWDKEHAEFMKGFVVDYKARGWNEEHEVPYNWYGQRGWIDILLYKGNTLLVCELKPKLENVGDTIRQVKQAQEVFLKALPSYKKFDNIQYLLVLKANNENLRFCKEYFDLLKDLDVLFWAEDKEKDEQINLEYKKFISDQQIDMQINVQPISKSVAVKGLCLICQRPIAAGEAMCNECLKFGWS